MDAAEMLPDYEENNLPSFKNDNIHTLEYESLKQNRSPSFSALKPAKVSPAK